MYEPNRGAKHNGPEDESRVPLLGVLDGDDAEVQEDDAVMKEASVLTPYFTVV